MLFDFMTGMMYGYDEPIVLPATSIHEEIVQKTEQNSTHDVAISSDVMENAKIISALDEARQKRLQEKVDAELFEHLVQKSGVILSRYGGDASIASSVRDEYGHENVIASGLQSQKGYGLSFENPIKENLLFYDVVPRYMHHDITIRDFRATIPTYTIPNKERIPFVVTNFESGKVMNPEDPNRYDIGIETLDLDLIVGGGVYEVYDCGFMGPCVGYIGVSAGVSLLGYQELNVRLGSDTVVNSAVKFLPSKQWALNSYFVLEEYGPMIFRFGYLNHMYDKITLPKAVEFRNSIAFNASKQIFERERIFVDSVELDISSYSFSIGVLF